MRRAHSYIKGIVGLVVTLFLISLPQTSQAADSGTFTYKVIHPENQRSTAGYFDLRMTPNQQQTVQIELTNPSEDTPVTVEVKRNAVKTNANGVLEYGPNTVKKDPSATIDFDTIVRVPETIRVEPGETKNVDIAIQMPEQSFDGVVSGGIQLQVQETEEAKKERASQSGVTTQYAFLVGVLLSETDEPVKPEISFNSISPGLSNYRNAIFVNFSNTEQTFIGDMSVTFDVRKKGSQTILYDTKKTGMKMAPTSMIDFPLLLNGDQMEAGNYIGHVLVTSGTRKWEWEEAFEITQKEADKYNKQDVSLVQEQGINWKLILMIVGLVLVTVLVIVLFIYLLKRRKKQLKLKQNKLKKRKQK